MKVFFLVCCTWVFLGWNSVFALSHHNNTGKCFGVYGCFSTRYPYAFRWWSTARTPVSPEKLQVKLLLSTRNHNKTVIIKDLLLKQEVNQHLDLNKPIKIIASGFLGGDGQFTWTKKMRDVLLRREDCNVMVITWKEYEVYDEMPLLHRMYGLARANARMLGAVVGEFLYRLNVYYDYNLDMVHIYGHSLGAHVAGYIGKYCKNKAGEAVIGTITGLDPAGPMFEKKPPAGRLDSTDAKFVLALHTNAGSGYLFYLGIAHNVGHVDVFPNGGRRQPGCSLLKFNCSHMRATEYAIEWLDRTNCLWIAYWCKSWKNYKKGRCKYPITVTLGLNYSISDQPMPTTGKYYMYTNSKYPYCY